MSASPRNLVFLGRPGAGKGTQAAEAAKLIEVAHVSTGDLFRKNLSEGTPVGLLAKGYMDKGELVPDQVVCDMVKERIGEADAQNGFILDGFPRTVVQADVLAATLEKLGRSLDAVISFEIADEIVIERLSGRLNCSNCGAIFHKTLNPPAVEGVCDACGQTTLFTRKDDQIEAIQKRLAEYHEATGPLNAYYEAKGLLKTIDAAQPIETVRAALVDVLEAR